MPAAEQGGHRAADDPVQAVDFGTWWGFDDANDAGDGVRVADAQHRRLALLTLMAWCLEARPEDRPSIATVCLLLTCIQTGDRGMWTVALAAGDPRLLDRVDGTMRSLPGILWQLLERLDPNGYGRDAVFANIRRELGLQVAELAVAVPPQPVPEATPAVPAPASPDVHETTGSSTGAGASTSTGAGASTSTGAGASTSTGAGASTSTGAGTSRRSTTTHSASFELTIQGSSDE